MTKQTQHTPGPWKVIKPGYNMRGKYANCHGIAPEAGPVFAYLPNAVDVQQANARLIAAAPELLAALKAQNDPYLEPFEREQMRSAAIAKAEGKQ